ncbi:methyltransferase domain-containing protein [Streptomyces sp. NPDC046215]|uniref:SAM-dependent methyltransferase Erg6/SMT-type domain-containing protein n=1 Tax=Streptomyces stramineus TaxID=173861 RepID=A0ABN0ZBG4_9ACTN
MEAAQEIAAYEELARDPAERTRRSTRMIRDYYAFCTDIYRATWGESHHFPVFHGGESRAEAMAAGERDLADRGGFTAGMKVLEIGSGVGGPAVTIAAHSGAHVTGLDLVEHRVEHARAHAAARCLSHLTDFRVGDAADMPFQDASFDAVYSIEAICHMPDKTRVHAEAARVLKPGGLYLGSDWLQATGLTTEQQERFVEPVCRGFALPGLSTPDALRRDLLAAGFVVEDLRDVGADGALEPNWRELEDVMAAIPPADKTPLLDLMERAGTSLCTAARNGTFLIGCWFARKPS